MMHRLRSCRPLVLCLALMAALAPLSAAAVPMDPLPPLPSVAPKPRPVDARCTVDGAACIRHATYTADVCRVIEAAARDNALDTNFFARLLWKESLFDAAAVSPAGAQGIAQFMPDTARLRGLADAFNPAEALYASARYLSELTRAYGNIGLAAAYNGGEARIARFIAAKDRLPPETRAYVNAITGYSAEIWRDAPPDAVDLSLDKAAAFQAACIAYAAQRGGRGFRSTPPVLPWGVVLASNRAHDGLERQVARLQNRHAAIFGASRSVTPTPADRACRALQFAQIGRATRAEAEALCARLRSDGGDCMVLRN